jgi:hypothetical protein
MTRAPCRSSISAAGQSDTEVSNARACDHEIAGAGEHFSGRNKFQHGIGLPQSELILQFNLSS